MVQENCLKKILIICGPTSSGKTALAVECAKLLNTEVISADSMNIYSGLDIGTAKPKESEKEGIIHRLIDVVSPYDTFTVSDYKKLAEPCIEKIHDENKIPIVCGGTGFYINSILYDLSYGNGLCNPEIREYYKKLAEEKGNVFVYEILKEKDPESASKLHYNDVKRVIRALEIYNNGCKKSDINDEIKPKYDYRAYAFDLDREILYSRINTRVDNMIKEGLVDEVKKLVSMNITLDNQCMQGIGYKEIYSYLCGEISLNDAIDLIKLNTRHYAKRQITFFKKLSNIKWIKFGDLKETAKGIVEDLWS